MPSVTTTIEDTSPLLAYSANWRAGTSKDDNTADSYSQSSFTLTHTQGATMSLSFYGSSVTVFGARRQNHGNYIGQLDNNPAIPSNGQSNAQLFQQVLFSSNATLGQHNLTITNQDSNFFDVDFVTFESSVGKDDEDLIVHTFKDTHPSFKYSPHSSWTTPANVGLFMGGSGHATRDPSAVATFTFQGEYFGDAVALYGSVGPNSSTAYSVQVDNRHPTIFNANKAFFRPQQMLYFAGNLGAGQHSIKVQTAPPAQQEELAIDYATVYTTRSLGGSFLTTDSTHTISQIPPGAIAGLAFTTTISIFTTFLSLFLLLRSRDGVSIFGLFRSKPKRPVAMRSISPEGPLGPEFNSHAFLTHPSLERAESARSSRSLDSVRSSHSHSLTQISSRPPTSFTVPVSMSMSMTTTTRSNAPTHDQSVMGTPSWSGGTSGSDIYASTVSYPGVPASVSNGSIGSSAPTQATYGHTTTTTATPGQSEKTKMHQQLTLNPTGLYVQQAYDQPSAAGPEYIGIQLPGPQVPVNVDYTNTTATATAMAMVSPTATIVPPPEYYNYNSRKSFTEYAMHVANQ